MTIAIHCFACVSVFSTHLRVYSTGGFCNAIGPGECVRMYVCTCVVYCCVRRSSVIVLPGPAGMWLPLQSQTRPYPFHGRWRLQSRVPHPMGTSLPWSQVRVIHTHGRMYAHGHAMHTIVLYISSAIAPTCMYIQYIGTCVGVHISSCVCTYVA